MAPAEASDESAAAGISSATAAPATANDKGPADAAPTLASAGVEIRTAEKIYEQVGTWKQGEVFYEATGLVGQYLLVPKECDDPVEVLQWACKAWGLQLPNLVVVVDGGHYPFDNWYDWLMNKESWAAMAGEGGDPRQLFQTSVHEIMKGVVRACSECDAWLYTYCDNFTGRGHYESKTEVVGEARLDEEEAARGKARSVPQMTGHALDDWPLWGIERFRECAHEVGASPPEGEAWTQVIYPRMRHLYVKKRQFADEHGNSCEIEQAEEPDYEYIAENPNRTFESDYPQGRRTHDSYRVHQESGSLPPGQSVMMGHTTHLIIYEEGSRLHFHSIEQAFDRMLPKVKLCMAGNVKTMCDGWSRAMTPHIILRNTGAAADMLSESLLRKRRGFGGAVVHEFAPLNDEKTTVHLQVTISRIPYPCVPLTTALACRSPCD